MEIVTNNQFITLRATEDDGTARTLVRINIIGDRALSDFVYGFDNGDYPELVGWGTNG